MENKGIHVIRSLLWGAGILLLLAAAFDIIPMADNQAIFLALVCFVVSAVMKRIAKGGGCCK